MNKSILFLLLSIFLQQTSMADTAFPQDVLDFIEKREACDHFRGEYSGDPEIDQGRKLYEQLDFYCPGTDKELFDLKTKYGNN